VVMQKCEIVQISLIPITYNLSACRCPDAIVCLDANFQQKHFSHVKEEPSFLEKGDEHGWVGDNEVEESRLEVEQARATPTASARSRLSSTIPSKVLDECEESYKAAQEKMRAVNDDAFDSKGVMALVCVHDVPLLLADVKTRGEPRYLAISLLKKLSNHLPEHATIGVMYDIGDQLDRTIEKVQLIILISLFKLRFRHSTIFCRTLRSDARLQFHYFMLLDVGFSVRLFTTRDIERDLVSPMVKGTRGSGAYAEISSDLNV
jgi:hypothetical protein